MKKRKRLLRAAVAACARAVITEHLASPQTPRVVDARGHISSLLWVVQPAGVPEKSDPRPWFLRWGVSLNRHKVWPGAQAALYRYGAAGISYVLRWTSLRSALFENERACSM
jgi:hypothetical protein